jgi:hypothetical protein
MARDPIAETIKALAKLREEVAGDQLIFAPFPPRPEGMKPERYRALRYRSRKMLEHLGQLVAAAKASTGDR